MPQESTPQPSLFLSGIRACGFSWWILLSFFFWFGFVRFCFIEPCPPLSPTPTLPPQLQQVIEDTSALKERQETPDSPEALTCMPSLKVSEEWEYSVP